jgi:N-acetylneuraminic acid mutarotase
MNRHHFSFFKLLLLSFVVIIGACKQTPKPLTQDLGFRVSVDSSAISLKTKRYGHGAVNDGEFLYIIGGSNSSLLSDIEIINLQTNETATLPNIMDPRRYFSAVFDGKESVYLIGGMSPKDDALWFNPNIEVFNTRTKTLRKIGEFSFATRINAAVFHGNTIYVMGGDVASDWGLLASNRMFSFNVETKQWRSMADMPSAKATKAVVHDDFIYVVGGQNNDKAMDVFERYDINNNTWETLPQIGQEVSGNVISVVDNKLFSFGDIKQLDLTLLYDLNTQTWRKVNLGFLRTRHAAISTVGNTIYVTGGTRNTRNGALDLIQTIKINEQLN